MIVKLDIENHWVEEGVNGEIIHRVMTLEEFLELQCEVCLENAQEFQIEINQYSKHTENEMILVCSECAKLIVSNLMNDPNFIDGIEIDRL